MMRTIARKMQDDERGFTLIELMVVVLIIGILIAIALPTFLGARERAQNRAAQSSDRNALVAAKTAFTDSDDYSEATDAFLDDIEPSLQYVPGGQDSTGPKEVSVSVSANEDEWAAAVKSDSGACFYIRDVATGANPTPGTFYGSDPTGAACSGGDALVDAVDPDGW